MELVFIIAFSPYVIKEEVPADHPYNFILQETHNVVFVNRISPKKTQNVENKVTKEV